jgi:hypothetical protein
MMVLPALVCELTAAAVVTVATAAAAVCVDVAAALALGATRDDTILTHTFDSALLATCEHVNANTCERMHIYSYFYTSIHFFNKQEAEHGRII